ncbi:MAG TPA: hypothetical protein VFQ58_07435, partial [Flavisolibacter sp.]|nr:hypothetical protein [Flavisolibacter sp.]
MRRIVNIFAAFILLLVFSFNLFGYKVLFDYLQHRNDLLLEASLDKNEYNEDDLITIKVPITLPYQTDMKDFERIDGEITINGMIYKYVKKKIEQGQLVLKCLPDQQKMQLQTGKDEFFKLANEFAQYNQTKHSNHKNQSIFRLVVFEAPVMEAVTGKLKDNKISHIV